MRILSGTGVEPPMPGLRTVNDALERWVWCHAPVHADHPHACLDGQAIDEKRIPSASEHGATEQDCR